MLFVGLGFYALNLTVGIAAQAGLRFGVWHHALYAVVFVTTVAAVVWAFHPGLLLTLAVLLCFPEARPHSLWHPVLAVLGLVGYLLALPTS